MLLAVALGSLRKREERRLLPDCRSGIDRRQARLEVAVERRSTLDRRLLMRRVVDRAEGATLLQKARSRLTRLQGKRPRRDDPADGLR
jgi:hypothetical protein